MKLENVLDIIENASDLPTLSPVALKVVNVTTGRDTSVKEVAELIEKDVALSAKVLQVVNSAFYGFSRGISSISEAVGLMGFKQVGSLALGLSVMGNFSQEDILGFSFREFWEQSVGNAVAAVKITAVLKPGASHSIFTTALLQNIGTCLLVRYTPLAYGYAMAVSRERKIHIVHAEREVLGHDHAEVGAYLVEQWNFPFTMRIPIRHHHYLQFGDELHADVSQHKLSTEVKVLCISHLVTAVLYSGDEVRKGRQKLLYRRAKELLKMDTDQVDKVLDALPGEIEQARALFAPVAGEPEVAEVPDEDEAREALRDRPRRKKNKILVAEDSAATRIAISNMLKRMGYDVVIAFNGKEAVALARREKPDLILMDVLMPVMDGIDALRTIRSDTQLRTTPIVMLTSVTDIRMVTEAIECGANDYIAKPFQVSLLIERVERYIHAR